MGAFAYHHPGTGETTVSFYCEEAYESTASGMRGSRELTVVQAREVAANITAVCDTINPPLFAGDRRECVDCAVIFVWDESPDDDRCAFCAEVHAWFHGCEA